MLSATNLSLVRPPRAQQRPKERFSPVIQSGDTVRFSSGQSDVERLNRLAQSAQEKLYQQTPDPRSALTDIDQAFAIGKNYRLSPIPGRILTTKAEALRQLGNYSESAKQLKMAVEALREASQNDQQTPARDYQRYTLVAQSDLAKLFIRHSVDVKGIESQIVKGLEADRRDKRSFFESLVETVSEELFDATNNTSAIAARQQVALFRKYEKSSPQLLRDHSTELLQYLTDEPALEFVVYENANLLSNHGHYKEAVTLFQKIPFQKIPSDKIPLPYLHMPDRVYKPLMEGQTLLENPFGTDYKTALTHYQEALKTAEGIFTEPNEFAAFIHLRHARCYYHLQDTERQAHHLDQAETIYRHLEAEQRLLPFAFLQQQMGIAERAATITIHQQNQTEKGLNEIGTAILKVTQRFGPDTTITNRFLEAVYNHLVDIGLKHEAVKVLEKLPNERQAVLVFKLKQPLQTQKKPDAVDGSMPSDLLHKTKGLANTLKLKNLTQNPILVALNNEVSSPDELAAWQLDPLKFSAQQGQAIESLKKLLHAGRAKDRFHHVFLPIISYKVLKLLENASPEVESFWHDLARAVFDKPELENTQLKAWLSAQVDSKTPPSLENLLLTHDVAAQSPYKVAGMDPTLNVLLSRVALPFLLDGFEKKKFPQRSGLLLYGPKGTGKTSIANYLADMLDVPLVKLSYGKNPHRDVNVQNQHGGVALIGKQVQAAIAQAPSVLLIEEIDGFLPPREQLGTHQSYKLEEVNTLLDALSELAAHGVLVIGTTNFLDRLDQTAIRDKRFDHKIEIPAPNLTSRAEMFKHYLKKSIDGSLQTEMNKLAQYAAEQTEGLTPDNIQSICEQIQHYNLAMEDTTEICPIAELDKLILAKKKQEKRLIPPN